MIESVKNLITCKWCSSILKEPVILPCSESVCREHESHFRINNDNQETKCLLCHEEHKLNDEEHFLFNKSFEMVESFETLMQSPESSINEHFSQLRNRIDLVREDFINKINEASEKMMVEVEEYEKACLEYTRYIKNEPRKSRLSDIKADLAQRKSKTDYLVIDEKMWKDTISKGNEFCDFFTKETKIFKDEIFLGKEKKEKFEMKYSDLNDVFSSYNVPIKYVFLGAFFYNQLFDILCNKKIRRKARILV